MLWIGVNLMGFVILCFMYYNTGSSVSEKFTDQKLFKYLQLSVMLYLVFDTVRCIVDGMSFPFAGILSYISSTLYFVISPVPGMVWLFYCDYKIYNDTNGLIRRLRFYLIPAAVHTLLALTTPFTAYFFHINADNILYRSDQFWISWSVTFGYVAASYPLLALKTKRKRALAPRGLDVYFYLFQIPPIVLTVTQAVLNEPTLVGMGMILSTFIIFINIQNRRLHVDELVGAFNRKHMEAHMNNVFKGARKGMTFFSLMIEIDDMKSIHDVYGRDAGDSVLITVYKILESHFKKNAVISRFSYSEFAVFGQCSDASDVQSMVAAFEKEIEAYNARETIPYEISLNTGSAVSTLETADTPESILKRADDAMCQIKLSKKENSERISEYERLMTEVTNDLYENIYEYDMTGNRAVGKSTLAYFESLKIPGDMPFDKALVLIAQKQIKEEFRQGYIDMFTPKNVINAYHNGINSFKYDFMISQDGENYYWMKITARIFWWEHDRSLRMLTYRQNIDEEKRREREPIERLENELEQSRISIMLSQIRPHFIYNSLVAIQELCLIDPKTAIEAISEFSNYLRGNLDSLAIKNPIPFEKELKHVENYLALEKKRFGDKLNVVYKISVREFFIPALTIQPIVENAVRHGVTRREEGGTVTILTAETEFHIMITVMDDGIGFDPSVKGTDGRIHVGVENVRSRLASMCGGTLELHGEPGVGATAVIKIRKEALELR